MEFVVAFVALATVASAELEFFKGDLAHIQGANTDIKTAAGEVLKKERQLETLIGSITAIMVTETAMEAAASIANIKNDWATITTDEGPLTSGKPNDTFTTC